ncbi:hypothetical protein H9650_04890 [Psychrobacillus sp. Sa2BUA9]|uniref:Uncharacterized protein n=1 Tax=Psychrobacillus faecigallinarum TaxID=2762235 RepID=A0ABR8R7D7_9BACI|nr:hypothetical protein [Psychrobacillus faecigallinarum]MBD7943447.1 hypothetical protein [Psychrobacillus faecigallinarum]
MNKEIEEIIVKTFFEKRIQQRVLFELSSPQKRYDAFGRRNNFIRKELMLEIPKPNSDPEKIEKLLKKQGAGNLCYVITSAESDVDGKELPLIKALEDLIWSGLPFIISCIPNKLAYYQGEQAYGSPEKYILKRR